MHLLVKVLEFIFCRTLCIYTGPRTLEMNIQRYVCTLAMPYSGFEKKKSNYQARNLSYTLVNV